MIRLIAVLAVLLVAKSPGQVCFAQSSEFRTFTGNKDDFQIEAKISTIGADSGEM